MKAATTIYHGDYDGLAEAWGQFDEWVRSQGLTPAENLWEIYSTGPQSTPDPEKYQTELYRPLAG